ncbi:MAG: alpha/beta hydrolase-fold protein [Caulobacteraceae bacterium]
MTTQQQDRVQFDAESDFKAEALGPATLNWSQTWRLHSKIIGQDFLIEGSYPPVAPAPGEKFPAVFVLDGNQTFGMTAGLARAVQSGPFPLPPTLVIGIGYHFERPEEMREAGRLRIRDFTPCSDALYEQQYAGTLVATGGADDFLAFIETELKPFLAGRLPIDLNDTTLAGTSLGGFFSLYAMLKATGAFRRHIAISPAIYWGGGKLFEMEAALAEQAQDLPVALHLAAGGLEEGHDPRSGLVSNTYQMEARLRRRRYPGLELSLRVHEGETHMSVFPGAMTWGLGQVFGGYRDMSDWERWLANLRAA